MVERQNLLHRNHRAGLTGCVEVITLTVGVQCFLNRSLEY